MKLCKLDYNVKIMQPWIAYCRAAFIRTLHLQIRHSPRVLVHCAYREVWEYFVQSPRGYDEEEFFRVYSDQAVDLTVSEGSTCKRRSSLCSCLVPLTTERCG